jgi:hypothetical protein
MFQFLHPPADRVLTRAYFTREIREPRSTTITSGDSSFAAENAVKVLRAW